MASVTDFPVGTYVLGQPDVFGRSYVGTVRGITLNAVGEIVLEVDMAMQRITADSNDIQVLRHVGMVHPDNVRKLDMHDKTIMDADNVDN